MTTCTTSPILPTAGDDHWPCRIRSPTLLTSQISLPVFLLTAIIEGALGEGMLTWLSSCPFDVLTKIKSPYITGDELDMLCGCAPTSSIMSNFQMMSASVLPVSFSSLYGPLFSPSRKPLVSRHISSPRFVT